MARITPIRSYAVMGMIEARLEAEQVFRRDGQVDPAEQEVLDQLALATGLIEFAELTRKLGDQVRDTGAITAWGQRQVREFVADHPEVRAFLASIGRGAFDNEAA